MPPHDILRQLKGLKRVVIRDSGGFFDDAVGEDFLDGDFEDSFDLVEFDGRVAGKDGLYGSFDVGI